MIANFPVNISKYQFLEKLGSGQFGSVYRAMNVNLSAERAVKLILHDGVHGLDNLLNEAKNLHACSQSHIVEVFDASLIDINKQTYVAIEMEYLSEGSALKICKSQGLSISELLACARHTLSALVHMHKNGIIHRDIKPANILFSPPNFKIGDFGISFLKSQSAGAPNLIYIAHAPPDYGPNDADESSDVYAVGMSLYRLLLPRDSVKLNSKKMNRWYTEGAIRPLPDSLGIPSYVPLRLRKIIQKATAPKRKDRYKSAREMLYDIERLRVAIPWKQSADKMSWHAEVGGKKHSLLIRKKSNLYLFRYEINGRKARNFNEQLLPKAAAMKNMHKHVYSTSLQ